MSRPSRGAWTAAVAVGLIIASGCGLSDGADQRGEPSPQTSSEEPIGEPDASPSSDGEGAQPSGNRGRLLDEVEHWLYLIDVNLDPDTVDEIVESEHDLVVLDFISSEQQNTDYPIGDLVDRLHEADHHKLVLAYIDIGQAEDYRVYWREDWQIGDPDWIVANDPDGWEGNYPVAYWREEWQAIWLGEDGFVSQIVDAGFDGVYLDWVEAYSDENVATAAGRDSVDPFDEMADWVAALAETGRDGNAIFHGGFGADWDNMTIGFHKSHETFAAGSGLPPEAEEAAARKAGFDGAADLAPALRALLMSHHDTLAVKMK